MIPAKLSIDHVHKTFLVDDRTVTPLRNCTATFLQSATYALTGPSGSGKSTLLYILAGLAEPTSGSVSFSTHGAHHSAIGIVFQKNHAIDELSVIENVMLPALIAGTSYDESYAHARELLRYVDLGDQIDDPVGALSGGQQQRVQIARALCNKPAFLLSDEPTSNLDAANSKIVMDLLLDCHRAWKMGLIISTHSPAVAQQMDHHYRLEDGILLT